MHNKKHQYSDVVHCGGLWNKLQIRKYLVGSYFVSKELIPRMNFQKISHVKYGKWLTMKHSIVKKHICIYFIDSIKIHVIGSHTFCRHKCVSCHASQFL